MLTHFLSNLFRLPVTWQASCKQTSLVDQANNGRVLSQWFSLAICSGIFRRARKITVGFWADRFLSQTFECIFWRTSLITFLYNPFLSWLLCFDLERGMKAVKQTRRKKLNLKNWTYLKLQGLLLWGQISYSDEPSQPSFICAFLLCLLVFFAGLFQTTKSWNYTMLVLNHARTE